MINLSLSDAELQVLAGLITAGAKSPHTGAEAIVQAAKLLEKLQEAANASVKPVANGHAIEEARPS